MRKNRIKWVEKVKFVGESASGHGIVLDGAADSGGSNLGMRPLELMALGTGGCSAYDVVTILQKARQQVTACEVEIEANRVDATPAVFDSIHLHFRIAGKDLNEQQVARAISLSAEKYCSASIMLKRAGVTVTHDYQII